MTDLTRFLSKAAIVAPADYNRWLVPPAALAVHLSIGMAYGFSVFWLPLSKAVGITASAPDDWTVTTVKWMFTLFIVFLGSSAAVFGAWVERNGPRAAGLVAAACWSGGFAISAAAVAVHSLPLLWLGAIVGGCGLGLGYISPVSTLIAWFPDRRGLATGLAIMGFGGGAIIGTPLADALMKHFAGPSSVGVWQTFLVLGALYAVAMTAGALGYRLPPPGWAPAGAVVPVREQGGRSVPVGSATLTPQFWLLWGVLLVNVSAGIGVLAMASPMIQEVFKGRVGTSEAAGFTGLLSLFNIAGRLGWASLSDRLGRQATYAVFFLLGAVLYAAVPFAGRTGNIALFVGLTCAILTMYGGGFATIPAYLADRFGSGYVSAIHGRLLTAWSLAGVVGPVLVSSMHDHQVTAGIAPVRAYDTTFWLLAALLGVGFVCNALVKPVPADRFEDLAADAGVATSSGAPPSQQSWVAVAAAWSVVGVPLAWGTWRTLQLAVLLF